jgi:hypothetical protein
MKKRIIVQDLNGYGISTVTVVRGPSQVAKHNMPGKGGVPPQLVTTTSAYFFGAQKGKDMIDRSSVVLTRIWLMCWLTAVTSLVTLTLLRTVSIRATSNASTVGMQYPLFESQLRRSSKASLSDSDASQDLAIHSRYPVLSKNMAFSLPSLPSSSLTPFCRRRSSRQHVSPNLE